MKGKLNPKEIDSLSPGTYGDGNNLYLVVKPTGARSYMLRYQWQGRPQKMGLGAADKIKLADARDKAIDASRLLAKGINPRDDRDEKRNAVDSVLFFDFAETLRLEKERGFKHRAHKAKWRRTVHVHAKALHKKRLSASSIPPRITGRIIATAQRFHTARVSTKRHIFDKPF